MNIDVAVKISCTALRGQIGIGASYGGVVCSHANVPAFTVDAVPVPTSSPHSGATGTGTEAIYTIATTTEGIYALSTSTGGIYGIATSAGGIYAIATSTVASHPKPCSAISRYPNPPTELVVYPFTPAFQALSVCP